MTAAFHHKPIVGGVFGHGRYALATLPTVRFGLHVVRYLVIDPIDGKVLSVADCKSDALAAARDVLKATERLAQVEAAQQERESGQFALWPPDAFEQPPVRERSRPVSKRRRDVYAKCGGACHYCKTPLRLDGSWHVEHSFPKALGGLDEIGNLFASCAPCNLSKSSKTSIHFVVSRETRDQP